MRSLRSVVVVGASLAGMRAAETLRLEGFDGRITMVGEEEAQPYDRPPLSKEILSGAWAPERTALYKPEALEKLDLTWRLGAKAAALDLQERSVRLEDGQAVHGDGIVLATGARPRTLSGADAPGGVYTLRTLSDALALRRELTSSPSRLVVVGAGFIGAEVAAVARELGLDVTVVEMTEVPLQRVLGAEMGSVCAEVHSDHGVDMRLGVKVSSFVGGDRVQQVILSDGSKVEADLVVVGVGVMPNTDWLLSSGLRIDDGVVCDETCLAAPGVVAAGDAARWPNRLFGASMRVEHWDNAVEQGSAAARRLLADAAGDPGAPYAPVPWFWSDQYDRKIQLAGCTSPEDEVKVVTGSVAERRFAAIYGRAGRIVGVLGFNRPRHVMLYRRLIASGASWEEALEAARAEG